MSPGVTARSETGNVTWTTRDSPAARFTRANPTSRLGGAITSLTGWWTYTGTPVAPALLPVFATVKVAVTLPLRETLDVADRPLVWNVVYESPKPKGQRGLSPGPGRGPGGF